MQSPVDIDTDEVLYDPHLELFNFYDYKITEGVQMQLENVGGHTGKRNPCLYVHVNIRVYT